MPISPIDRNTHSRKTTSLIFEQTSARSQRQSKERNSWRVLAPARSADTSDKRPGTTSAPASSSADRSPNPPLNHGYSIDRPNLLDFGKPCARRPASARLPRQSASSLSVMLCSRPAESFQESPLLESKVATSDSEALVYFCKRTPRPRAISGTWSIGKTTILWLVPITATVSPCTVVIAR